MVYHLDKVIVTIAGFLSLSFDQKNFDQKDQ